MYLFTLPLASPVGHSYYTTCYLLAFAVQAALLLRTGFRRGYPLPAWLVLLAASTLAFIVGTKLITIPLEAWPALLRGGAWPADTARSVLGGGLGFGLMLLVLRRWLGFGWHVADVFAGPLCAGLVVQCVGCLLTGCCFGEPTHGGWGLTYAAGSLPYYWQQAQGLLPAGAAHSLAVHPTQLYTLLLCAAVGLVLWLTRHRRWPAGSWALLQAGLLVAGRLLIEGWRDPAGEPLGANFRTLGGLRLLTLQWALLPVAGLLLGAFGWRLYRARRAVPAPEVVPHDQPVRTLAVVAGLLLATALLPAGALTLPELLVVKSALLAVLAMATASVLHEAAAARRLGLPLAMLSAVLLFTNQTAAPADSARAYFSFTPGFTTGSYDEDASVSAGSGSCSGPASRVGYYHQYQAVGGDFAYTRPTQHKPGRVSYGIGVWGGHEYVNAQVLAPGGPFLTANPKDGQRYQLLDVNPYIERDRVWPSGFGYGVRAGLHVGQLAHAPINARPGSDLEAQKALPDVKVWIGVRRVLYGQVEYGNGLLALGNPVSRFALGSGLGSTWNGHVLAGLAVAEHAPTPSMAFVSGSFPLGRSTGLWLEPYAATDFGRHYQASVRLQYRLADGRR